MRWMAGVMAAVGLLGCGAPDMESGGEVGGVGQEIVGGTTARQGEVPWQVALKQNGYVFCGGVILDATTVITSAHCVEYIQGTIQVTTGTNLNQPISTHTVTAVRPHSGYSDQTSDNDIALLKLTPAISFDSKRQPIALVTPADETAGLTAAGVMATTSGWGALVEGSSSFPSDLMRVDLPLVAQTTLQRAYSGTSITSNMIGAGYPQGGKSSCSGDSGGPLTVLRNNGVPVLAGITSFGQGCARPGLPGVYTRISKYNDWIAANKS